MGPYKTIEEVVECMLYWQMRALEAEKNRDEDTDTIEIYIEWIIQKMKATRRLKKDRDYYKQQFLDKEKEIKILLKHATFITGGD